MPLVDYASSTCSSSSSAPSPPAGPGPDAVEDGSSQPSAKRRKIQADGSDPKPTAAGNGARADPTSEASSGMPPLPSAFYDLYASTVRHSKVDDPTLHQGRKRHTPHIAGNWPSHLYIEWFPDAAQHDLLSRLLQQAEADMSSEAKLHSFLTSDLGAHLPLHISLSRPISLATPQKDDFLEAVTAALGNSGVDRFSVRPVGLAWYRSPDSDRSFLILRVTSAGRGRNTAAVAVAPNPELSRLLVRSNNVVRRFGQPTLYQRSDNDPVGTAFHVSIAWTLDHPSEETRLRATDLFVKKEFRAAHKWDIDVSGVKVKIGNVVSHVPLSKKTGDGASNKELLFS